MAHRSQRGRSQNHSIEKASARRSQHDQVVRLLRGELDDLLGRISMEALAVALRNLVDNALKYSPDQPAVWVEWGPENGRVAIRVRDKGMGIAESERNAIFRKFVRGSAAAAGNVRGTGVGLAMVRQIVIAHGGSVRVESDPGRGSTFTMLPPASGRV
jgi:signal transduction histidine kinase